MGERQLHVRSFQEIERQRTNKSQVTEVHEYVHLEGGATGDAIEAMAGVCSCGVLVLSLWSDA